MAEGLVAHLSARFVFVVGKGGVGKSTTAGALSLALADGGQRTHLLSTDPAHSLADLFGATGSTEEPWISPCSPALTVEELDGPRRVRRWLAEVEAPIADLIERGTYLDREDVSALLACSLPGMDEVMAALRVAELAADGRPERVVVDTAPTGHTLRLLDSGAVLDGWVAAAEAMAAKAGAVAYGLTGRRVRFAGEQIIQDLRADVRRFTNEVLPDADFVVVTRSGDVVAAETGRLLQDLRGRGLRPAAVVAVGALPGAHSKPDGAPVVEVATQNEPAGCDGLRAWGRAAGPAPGRSPDTWVGTRVEPPRRTPAVVELLPPRALMLFAGKGGVGKSTCAAAYALALAKERDVLLLSTDPAGSLGDVFGLPVTAEPTQVAPRLVARQLDADAEYARFRADHRERIRGVFEGLGLNDSAPLDRRVLESIVDMAPPGLDEIFAVDAILDGPGGRDVLVLDTAPTGHFLRLLQMPEIALAWTRAVLRVLLKYRAVLGLDGIAQDLLQWAKRLKGLLELLRDEEHCGVVIVTLPEALPLRETDRLVAALGEGKIPVAAIIQNRWTPSGAARLPAPASTTTGTTISAPSLSIPPVGPAALLTFVERWSVA